MPAKKVMPKGGRKASPTLWAMVRGLTEDEWELVSLMAIARFKDPLQFRLLKLLRSMEVYDPATEKAEFAEHNLGSMRRTARRWLIRTASKLAFYQTEVALEVMDVDALLRWGIHDETMDFIAGAKQLAMEQEEYGQLALLLRKEARAASSIFQGADRVNKMGSILHEAVVNGRLIALEAEIEHQHTVLVERIRHDLLTNGTFDKGLAESYLKGKFYRQNINGWPISFQIRKLRIDEAIHYFLGDPKRASIAAEISLPLIARLDQIRQQESEEYPKCMFRLSAYYAEFGANAKLFEIISSFRELAMNEKSGDRTYLKRLIYTLIRAAFQFETPRFAEEAMSLWNKNFEVLNRNPRDGIRFITLLCVLAYHLSKGDNKAARATFGLAMEISFEFQHLIYQSLLKVFHLMILIDEEDERGLQSYGKNYKRHLNAFLRLENQSQIASAALELITILSRESNLQGSLKLAKSLNKMLSFLNHLKHHGDINFTPFVYPMTIWAKQRLGTIYPTSQ